MRILKRNTFKQHMPRENEPVPAWEPRVITVTSGKGGVGKTNLTVNLAIALAGYNQRVIVFDADLGLSNVDVLLGISPPVNLHDHLYRDVPIEAVLLEGPGGIRIVSGGSGFLELASLDSRQRNRLLDSINKLNNMADFILIDTGAGISKDVLAFCAAADEVLVVITPEPTSMADAYALIKVLDKFKLQRDVYVAVNQSRNDNESISTVKKMRTLAGTYLTIRFNYLGNIPYDPAVVRAVKYQSPFVLDNPGCQAAARVKAMANSIIKREIPPAQETGRGLHGFINKLSRLFR